MRRFELHRHADESGVSGTGVVAEGVMFGDGTAVMRWKSQFKSTVVYESMSDLKHIHGHGGFTEIVWVDNPPVDWEEAKLHKT